MPVSQERINARRQFMANQSSKLRGDDRLKIEVDVNYFLYLLGGVPLVPNPNPDRMSDWDIPVLCRRHYRVEQGKSSFIGTCAKATLGDPRCRHCFCLKVAVDSGDEARMRLAAPYLVAKPGFRDPEWLDFCMWALDCTTKQVVLVEANPSVFKALKKADEMATTQSGAMLWTWDAGVIVAFKRILMDPGDKASVRIGGINSSPQGLTPIDFCWSNGIGLDAVLKSLGMSETVEDVMEQCTSLKDFVNIPDNAEVDKALGQHLAIEGHLARLAAQGPQIPGATPAGASVGGVVASQSEVEVALNQQFTASQTPQPGVSPGPQVGVSPSGAQPVQVQPQPQMQVQVPLQEAPVQVQPSVVPQPTQTITPDAVIPATPAPAEVQQAQPTVIPTQVAQVQVQPQVQPQQAVVQSQIIPGVDPAATIITPTPEPVEPQTQAQGIPAGVQIQAQPQVQLPPQEASPAPAAALTLDGGVGTPTGDAPVEDLEASILAELSAGAGPNVG